MGVGQAERVEHALGGLGVHLDRRREAELELGPRVRAEPAALESRSGLLRLGVAAGDQAAVRCSQEVLQDFGSRVTARQRGRLARRGDAGPRGKGGHGTPERLPARPRAPMEVGAPGVRSPAVDEEAEWAMADHPIRPHPEALLREGPVRGDPPCRGSPPSEFRERQVELLEERRVDDLFEIGDE